MLITGQHKPLKFTIGTHVLCKAKCHFSYDWISGSGDPVKHSHALVSKDPYKTLKREPCAYIGWVVGVVRRYEGKLKAHKSDSSYGYDSPYFKPTKQYFLWKVVNSLTAKPIECLEEDMESKVVQTYPPSIPFQISKRQPWSEQDRNRLREEMREEMREWPRDSKGRWTKKAK
jgi:hypothetical protein